jgi:hypothetical protein
LEDNALINSVAAETLAQKYRQKAVKNLFQTAEETKKVK